MIFQQLRNIANMLFRKHHGGSTLIRRDPRGVAFYEEWRRDGRLHREGAPAVVTRGGPMNDVVTCEEWWLEGQRHREDGPAYIWPFPGGDARFLARRIAMPRRIVLRRPRTCKRRGDLGGMAAGWQTAPDA